MKLYYTLKTRKAKFNKRELLAGLYDAIEKSRHEIIKVG
jgi:hypothetical protein